MTPDDLIDDLGRLLREGLVCVEAADDEEDHPRFRVTAHGRAIVEQADDQEGAHGDAA